VDRDGHAAEDSAVAAAALATIRAHAAETWPDECCGLVFADGTVRRCANVHPAPRTAFRLAPADTLLLARSMDSANPARVLYHSHVHDGARLSAADRSCAALHPRLAMVVVAGRHVAPRAFRLL
jgi:adenylyltransferase/sulfurtransferase